MWKYKEIGNRIQSFRIENDTGQDEKYENKTLSDVSTLVFISVESNVMCWNPSYGDVIKHEEGVEGGRGWIFSTPSTPRYIAAEILGETTTNKNSFVVVHSSSQTIQTRNALVKVVEEIVYAGGGDKNRIVAVSGGTVVEATSFCIVNFESIFSPFLKNKFEIVICPSWEDESIEYKNIENGTNSLLFHHYSVGSVNTSFYDRLVDQIKYRHTNGDVFVDLISKERCRESNLFEEGRAYEITSSHEAAFDSVVGNISNVTAIIMCGQPGGELEDATSKLVSKIKKVISPDFLKIFDQRMCIGLKAGIKRYETLLYEELKIPGKKIIFASPNVRKSERELLKSLVNRVLPEANVLTALITKPSWWKNSREGSSSSKLSNLSLRSYSLLFDPPDCENESNVVRLI